MELTISNEIDLGKLEQIGDNYKLPISDNLTIKIQRTHVDLISVNTMFKTYLESEFINFNEETMDRVVDKYIDKFTAYNTLTSNVIEFVVENFPQLKPYMWQISFKEKVVNFSPSGGNACGCNQ
jgi:hypothetical protein